MKKMLISIIVSAAMIFAALLMFSNVAFATHLYFAKDFGEPELLATAESVRMTAVGEPIGGSVKAEEKVEESYLPTPLDPNDTIPDEFFPEPLKGSKFAPVKVVVYHDFQSPFDKKYWNDVVSKIHDVFSEEEVSITIINFPLSFHPNAFETAKAAECANLHSHKFFEYANLLFENQFSLNQEDLIDYAEKIGINKTAFEECLNRNPQIEQEVKNDFEFGISLGVKGVPTSFINGHLISGSQPFENIIEIISDELGQDSSTPVPESNILQKPPAQVVYPVIVEKATIISPPSKKDSILPLKKLFVTQRPKPIQKEFEPEVFKLSVGQSKELKFGETKLLVSLTEISNMPVKKCITQRVLPGTTAQELECSKAIQTSAKINVFPSNDLSQTYFLGLGEKIRVKGISIKASEIISTKAVFVAESGEYVKLPTRIPVKEVKIKPKIVIQPSIFGETTKSQLKPVKIGRGPLKLSIFPVKTLEVSGENVTESFEITRDIGTAASSAKSVKSISIKPRQQKFRAEIETESGTVLQEISSEFKPVVNYKEVLIEQDFLNKKIVLNEGASVVETTDEIEVNGDLFIKSQNFKKKLNILPTKAMELFRNNAKFVPKNVVLKIEGQKAIYAANETIDGKIFGFLPVIYEINATVDAQSGAVKVDKPFWSFLVLEN